MTIIQVWLYGSQNPLIFDNVDGFYETRHAIEIVQLDMYQDIRTKIYKQCLQYYKKIETR